MPDLRLGYKASAEQFHPQRLLNLAVAAEQCGFDSVWTSDHFQPWRHPDGHAPNALTWLARAAQATRRVILGTSVADPVVPLQPGDRRPGHRDARAASRRTGSSSASGPASRSTRSRSGSTGRSSQERFARLKEAIQLIQQLWRRSG